MNDDVQVIEFEHGDYLVRITHHPDGATTAEYLPRADA